MWLFLMVVVAALSAGCARSKTDITDVTRAVGSISGRVSDSGGVSVPFATVRTVPPTAEAATDLFGRYRIDNVPDGAYTVSALKSGQAARRVQVTVTGREVGRADISFAPVFSSGTVTVRYTRAADPYLRNAVVWIEDEAGALVRTLVRTSGPQNVCASWAGWTTEDWTWATWFAKNGKSYVDTVASCSSSAGSPGVTYTFTWDGKDRHGALAPDGLYRYRVEVAGYYEPDKTPRLSEGTILKDAQAHTSTGVPDGMKVTAVSATHVP